MNQESRIILSKTVVLALILFAFPALVWAAPEKINNFEDLKNTQINSYSAAVIDSDTGELLFGKREDTEKPVASITKILGADVYLSVKPDLNKKVKMDSADEVGGGRLKLPIGTTMRAKNFLHASLIGSANNSATGLMRLSDLGKNKFIDRMNDLAKEVGAEDANFVDASGISPNNKASAKDLALIGKKVYENGYVSNISAKKSYSFSINNGKGEKKIVHTSPIVSKSSSTFKVLAAKTGYLPEVGNNLIVKIKSKKNSKAKIIVVLMGASNQGATTQDATKIAKWAFKNYKW